MTSWTTKQSERPKPGSARDNKILLVNLGRDHNDTELIAESLRHEHRYDVQQINLLGLKDGFTKIDFGKVAAVDLKDCRGWQKSFDFFKKQMNILEQKIKETGREIPIINPPKMFDWVASKECLKEFSNKNVAIVPTTFLHRGDKWPDINAMLDDNPDKKLVLKPARGSRAGGVRFITKRGENEFELTAPMPLEESPTPHTMIVSREALENYLRGYQQEQIVANHQPAILIQPFCRGTEISAVFIGREAHYVERTTGETNPVAHEDFGGKNLPLSNPDPKVVAFAQKARDALPEHLADTPYVRVDMLYDGKKSPRLLEVEAGSARLFLCETNRTGEYADMVDKAIKVARRRTRLASHDKEPQMQV